jgi:DNA modification methylase
VSSVPKPRTKREWSGAPSLRKLLVPIGLLAPHPDNPRKHDLPAIRASLEELGQQKPIVVVPPGSIHPEFQTIVAGHGTTLAARELGWTHIAAVESDLSSEDIARFVLADNRTADRAGYDTEALAKMLGEVAERDALAGTGYDREDLRSLLADLRARDRQRGYTEPDDVPDVPEEFDSEPGKVYELGDHRVLCGDSCDAVQVNELLAGENPVALVTDPPYGVELDHRWREEQGYSRLGSARHPMMNDDRSDWGEAYKLSSAPIAYVWHGALHSELCRKALEEAGYDIRQQIIWAKRLAAFSRSAYHWKHECAWYAVRKGASAKWIGDRKQTTLWEAASPIHIMAGGGDDQRTRHPSQKPVAIYRPPIINHVPMGEAIYDPFAGSGTALIAAEELGRRCLAVELDPRFCDVIRQRYADFTGQPEFGPAH